MKGSRKVKIWMSVLMVLAILVVGLGLVFKDRSKNVQETEVLGRSNIASVPYIVNSPEKVGYEGVGYVYDVICSDSDTQEKDLMITLVDAPNWLFVEEKKIYGTPPVGSKGQYKLNIRVSDGENSSVKENYILIMENETN